MLMRMKLLKCLAVFSSLIALTAGQSRESKNSLNRKGDYRGSAAQGRTLGLIGPLLDLGLGSITRPFLPLDNDALVLPVVPSRPSTTSGVTQSNPYYGSYGSGNYGGYTPNYYQGYNHYGGLPFYRPIFAGLSPLFYGGYRPFLYPNNYGSFGAQQPAYTNPRPQRPATYPAITTSPQSASSTTNSLVNSAQALQIANLLGQLLGQQLRPLLSQGVASSTQDEPGIASSKLDVKRYRGRYY